MADGQEVHERISAVSNDTRSFRFDHVRVPLPVRESGGTFTVTEGTAAGTTDVVLQTTFEPLDPSSLHQLVGGVQAAFQQSLDSLRTYIEEKLPWDGR